MRNYYSRDYLFVRHSVTWTIHAVWLTSAVKKYQCLIGSEHASAVSPTPSILPAFASPNGSSAGPSGGWPSACTAPYRTCTYSSAPHPTPPHPNPPPPHCMPPKRACCRSPDSGRGRNAPMTQARRHRPRPHARCGQTTRAHRSHSRPPPSRPAAAATPAATATATPPSGRPAARRREGGALVKSGAGRGGPRGGVTAHLRVCLCAPPRPDKEETGWPSCV